MQVTADPAEIEAQIQDLVGRVQEDMAPGAYGQARDELVTFLEQELESTIDPEYEPLENQPDTARMTALFEEMIDRLDGLAD